MVFERGVGRELDLLVEIASTDEHLTTMHSLCGLASISGL